MTGNAPPLSPNKQALLKIRELKQQLTAAQEWSGEPIAIVSMACRFPRTSDTPEKFWQSLIDQTDLVSDIPGDRWDLDAFHDDDPEAPGKMYARRGVFLEQIDQMDPEFFGISPREASWVDPQQRLLMEVGWEAIERAGWIPGEIGEQTGVFVGWMHNDYQNEASDSFLNLNPYIATGAAGSFLCGRLAYYLGLQGPSVAVDTACSSSLVALHLAIQSLQRRDCDRALVGGVNAICSPTTNILTCKLKALSPSGQSRAFDAAADGYLRGEGCGVVTLARLADAEQSGDPVLGIIRGSAVGHNGFSSGLTAPNPRAQEKVIRQALQRAGVSPEQVGYLEAHGTGTELGDPIEVTAAAAAYCAERSDGNPLYIGSVKTNIGHLEAAAGMAGLIKVLLAMRNGAIPGQMNFETPNPHIPWDKIPVKVLTHLTQWPIPDQRIAGVSAFGMSGTNAHVIIEAPQPVDTLAHRKTISGSVADAETCRPAVITLSAKNVDAVFELAAAYRDALSQDESLSANELAAATNVGRSHFEYRAAIVASDRQAAHDSLRSLARGGTAANIFVGNRRRAPRVAWQFTGQGAQYSGMGRQLYQSQPVFRTAIDHCDQELRKFREGSLQQVLFDDGAESAAVDNTHWTQPAIFAVQMGLAQLLDSWNIRPDAVVGHSVGQYAAACVAGIMNWDDGLRLIAERGRLIGELPAGGRMLAIFAPEQVIGQIIADESKVSLAALNGTHVVISGDEADIDRIAQVLADRHIRSRKLVTSHAFHSHWMDPALEPFARVADGIDFQPPTMPLVCNLTGQVLPATRKLDGNYWAEHIRQPVQYAPGIDALSGLNCDVLIEVGPQAVLTRMAAANWNRPAETLISCLQKEGDDNLALATAIAQMYSQGITPDFRTMHRHTARRHVNLPTYPFQRRRFWGPDKPRAAHAQYHTAHPLLGTRISLAGSDSETRFESFIDTDSPAWMPDHEVMKTTVLPGAALVEMAIQAAGARAIENIVFEQPIRPTGRTALQTVIKTSDDTAVSRSRLETYASAAGSHSWIRHFACELVATDLVRPQPVDRSTVQASLPETDSAENFYRKMNSLGLNYGPAFRCIRELHFSDREVLTHLEMSGDMRGYTIPPTVLDSALHSLAVGLLKSDDDQLFLPIGIGRIGCFAAVDTDVWCHAKWKQSEGATRTADLVLFSDTGEVLLKIEDLKVQQVSPAAMRQISGVGSERLVYELLWKPTRLAASQLESRKWLVISGEDERGNPISEFPASLINELRSRQHHVMRVKLHSEMSFAAESGNEFRFCGLSRENWQQLFDRFADKNGTCQIDGITWMLPGQTDPSASIDYGLDAVLHFIQSLLDRDWRRLPCGLQLITTNAIATDTSSDVNPQQSQFWGLGRVIGAEQPELRCRILDLCSGELDDNNTVKLASEIIQTETMENQHAIRGGQLFAPRMSQARLGRPTPFAANENGSYLITGGLGMLGREIAMWLAQHGARQVVLVSRSQPDEAAREFIESMEQTGCRPVIHAADISSRRDVEQLFSRFGHDLNPLVGVVHAAGVLDDGLIESQTTDRFEKVLKPKVAAARLLDEFTRDWPLDFFVLYSSAASVLGSPGQSNYATGNAFLDGLAWQRRHHDQPATVINWGPWAAGMADDQRILKRLALQGITPLSVKEAHAALEKILGSDTIQATVMDVDWRRMRIGPTGDVPVMLQDLAGEKTRSRGADSALVSKLKKLQGKARRELLVQTIQQSLQRILSTPAPPEIDRPLIEMGLDSLMAVEFGTELQQMLGDQFNVGPTMLFDHPTIDAISDYVLELATAGDSVDGPNTPKQPSVPAVSGQPTGAPRVREDIAIIGMSCRFPGARNVSEFWQNLLDGVDSVCDIPDDRWDVDRFYSADREPGKMYTRRGGFLDDIAEFDAAFFNISPQEACWIDPQHRMLLENTYRALEDAGIASSPMADPNVGVFMGIMGSDYAFLPTLDDEQIIRGFQGAGLSHSAGVGRISYLFGFEGPSVSIDTASSSSLVAVFQAMRALQEGNCNLALAGGANAILAPVNSMLMSSVGLLSPDGRCKSFSKSADGFGRGEGCGVLVLKRLSDAQRDGDRIMAVIRGGAVVHNGFSGGITSPNSKAQSRVIDAAIRDAELAPSQVQYLEAHGTGTQYGDPMELNAAIRIYGKGRTQENPLLVGSVKANISHLEAAGGASGLIKTVLAIYHGIIPRQIHIDEPSPHIPWNRMPVKIVHENTSWPRCERRTAGITALGLVGTNAHLVLSAPADSPLPGAPAEPLRRLDQRLLVASARCPEALHEICESYARYLEQNPDTDLDDFCFTIGTGRRHFEHRLAVAFEKRTQAIEMLRAGGAASGDHHGFGANGNGASRNGRTNCDASTPVKTAPKLAWIFGSNAKDSHSSLRELVDSQSVIADFVKECDQRLRARKTQPGKSVSLEKLLQNSPQTNAFSQTMSFVLQSGLARLWQSWGIQPDAACGFGVGQYAAACVAGGLDSLDALVLVYEWETIRNQPDCRQAAWDAFEELADQFNFYPPDLPLVCSVSGSIVPVHRSLGGSYWRQQATAEPNLNASIEALNSIDFDAGLVLGSETDNRSLLSQLEKENVKLLNCGLTVPGTGAPALIATLARLYESGCNPDFRSVYGDQPRQKLSLPTYPFQKKRYWITEISQFMKTEETAERECVHS